MMGPKIMGINILGGTKMASHEIHQISILNVKGALYFGVT
jgi:hypothetical protein